MSEKSVKDVSLKRFEGDSECDVEDLVAVEEPLEIRVGYYDGDIFRHKAVSITMRTPGEDFELAVGFLFTEKIIASKDDISQIKHCGPEDAAGRENTVRVDLKKGVEVDLKSLDRHFYTTSSCGVCGKSSIEALSYGMSADTLSSNSSFSVAPDVVSKFPSALTSVQAIFETTGGLHASALFSADGELDVVREDVGRHNALDKLIGSRLLAGALPIHDTALFLSGRISFELVQKALAAGIPLIAAVGSPSSLAVELAEEYGITLVGFVRNGRFNVYCGAERIRSA
ncbi:MAG: formate dehydrogenase accessory sulfurtransferase FdhD [Pyrinomonadaceae bacterium]